jgi:hypothetical protein
LTIPYRLKLYYNKIAISGQIACCYFTTVSLGGAGVLGAVGQDAKPAKCHLRQNVHSMYMLLCC